ncbi:hypothetical protein AKO1_008096 [Acrasis kona]|uniref:Uncharacterized protein n=1 Tax=Acrasis kona TaxID=1008807 RepID=A0AAW2YQW3_9EUKA
MNSVVDKDIPHGTHMGKNDDIKPSQEAAKNYKHEDSGKSVDITDKQSEQSMAGSDAPSTY